MRYMKFHKIKGYLTACLVLSGCNISIQTDEGEESEYHSLAVENIFPTGLAAASPFLEQDNSLIIGTAARSSNSIPHYFWSTQRIGLLLNGITPLRDVFMPESFYRIAHNANCFGPSVSFTGHPNATDSTSENGTLPGGDLGIWLVEDENGDACAVAQTNALLSGVQDQSRMALMTLASLISSAISHGESLPSEGHTLNLTSYMNALGLINVTFGLAEITHSLDTWFYRVEFDWVTSGNSYSVWLEMEHMPGNDYSEYQGHLKYLAEGENGVTGVNLPGNNCSQDERSLAGSLTYERAGDNISLQARNATLCGHNVTSVFTSDGLVDSANQYSVTTNMSGWSENFNIFGANFDLTDLSGDYTYVWQAGVNDSNSRVFNIGLNPNEPMDGEAHYGYGDTVDNTDGAILGFICDWATPSSTHALQAYTQRQFIEYDTLTNTYLGSDHRANIEYAPTSTCSYDGLGNFVFDIDVSGVLGDITEESTSQAFIHDLWQAPEGLTIQEGLLARGIQVANVPLGWPADGAE